jgi:hypothetical protein
MEENILDSVRGLLAGRVNELLGEMERPVPLVEFGGYRGGSVVVPVINLSACERSEKERIIRIDTYSVIITFPVPEGEFADLYCYAYASAFEKALGLNHTLGDIVNSAVMTGKKYIRPQKPGCGEEWKLVISVRVTVEN